MTYMCDCTPLQPIFGDEEEQPSQNEDTSEREPFLHKESIESIISSKLGQLLGGLTVEQCRKSIVEDQDDQKELQTPVKAIEKSFTEEEDLEHLQGITEDMYSIMMISESRRTIGY